MEQYIFNHPHIGSFNSSYVYQFLFAKFNSCAYSFKINSEIIKSLYNSGYINFYEIVNTPLDYFVPSTKFTTSQLNHIQKLLSTYDLHIGMSPQELSAAIKKHCKDQYKSRIVLPILTHLEDQKNYSDVIFTHEQIMLYGQDLIIDNLSDSSLCNYYRYSKYLR